MLLFFSNFLFFYLSICLLTILPIFLHNCRDITDVGLHLECFSQISRQLSLTQCWITLLVLAVTWSDQQCAHNLIKHVNVRYFQFAILVIDYELILPAVRVDISPLYWKSSLIILKKIEILIFVLFLIFSYRKKGIRVFFFFTLRKFYFIYMYIYIYRHI